MVVHDKIFASFRLWACHVQLALSSHLPVRRPGMALIGPSNPQEVRMRWHGLLALLSMHPPACSTHLLQE